MRDGAAGGGAPGRLLDSDAEPVDPRHGRRIRSERRAELERAAVGRRPPLSRRRRPSRSGASTPATVSGELDPRVADVPERVYVPNEESDDVAVIDPETFEVIDRFPVGDAPEHVNPDWGLENLWVSNMNGGS